MTMGTIFSRTFVRTLAFVCVSLWVCPAPALAQDEVYRKGLEALDKKRWPEAAAAMRTAIEQNKNEANKKIKVGGVGPFGGTEYPYLPYYFLGEALMGQKNCVEAVVAFGESERQGVVDGQRLMTLHQQLQACAAEGVLAPSAYDPLYQRTNQKYTEATALYRRIQTLVAANKALAGASGDDALERAHKELDASYKSLTDGTHSRKQTDFSESAAAADRSTAILRRLESTIGAAVDTQTATQRQMQELDQAIAAAERIDKDIDDSGLPLTTALANSRKNARAELAHAREGQTAGQRAPAAASLKESIDHAHSASTILTDLFSQAKQLAQGVLDQKRADAVRSATVAVGAIDDAFASFDRRVGLETTPPPAQIAAERDTLRKDADGLKRQFARASKSGDVAGLTQTAQQALEIKAKLEALVQSLPPLSLRARGIPAGLEEGARLFLRGEYEPALSAMDGQDPAVSETPPMRLQLHLFRAAAQYALYVRSGETKKDLLAQAVANIEECKKLDAAFVPDARSFAPRFVQFYQQGQQAPGK
jgi:hypothetical protein